MVLTQKDLKEIERIVDERLDEKTGLLPTKDEFFSRMDEVIVELRDIRNEITIVNGRSSDNRERIERLDSIHPHGKHALA